MPSMQEHLVRELGQLPREAEERAAAFFDKLLDNLNCSHIDPATLRNPGQMSTRDRIVSYLDQMVPTLWSSDRGPEVERALNAILLNVQSPVRSQSNIGTVRP